MPNRRRYRPHRIAAWLGVLLVWVSPIAIGQTGAQAPAADAESISERMLAALGGRERWAALTSLVNDSYQHRSEAPNTVRASISMDFASPRWRIETTAPGLHLIRVWDGTRGQGWRLTRDGIIEDLPTATRDEDLRWHRAHVYRTLHRIAARDPALQLRLVDDRLAIFEGEQRIAWYRLSSNGEPYAFGAMDDDEGSRCGPWRFEQDGLRHPIWVANASGTWRADLKSLQSNLALDEALFARPEHLRGLPALHGLWSGDGQFRGNEASMRLRIEPVLSGAYTEWRIDIGEAPLFQGLLHQRRDLDGLHGHWIDSSGARLHVQSQLVGDCLRSDWQRGRSSYCLIDEHQLLVEDIAAGADQPFARYTLRRTDSD
jgi:hypothetical protein